MLHSDVVFPPVAFQQPHVQPSLNKKSGLCFKFCELSSKVLDIFFFFFTNSEAVCRFDVRMLPWSRVDKHAV